MEKEIVLLTWGHENGQGSIFSVGVAVEYEVRKLY